MILMLLQLIIDGFAEFLGLIVDVLPGSPFVDLDFGLSSELLGYINFFVPVSEILYLCYTWLVSITGYYVWMVVGRWVKLIQ